MTISKELSDFYTNYPWPEKESVGSLFRFSKIADDNICFLSHLFIDRKLYHPVPQQFNDPFECKPHFNWPKNSANVRRIRQHLTKVARLHGHSRNAAEAITARNMRTPEFRENVIVDAIRQAYSELRICSFTKRNDNLLFWSHYANSHKGFCIEFDATKMPMSQAFKVQYQNMYPEMEYPCPTDATGFIPALVKSTAWEYEEEFRTILVPESASQPMEHDGESVIFEGTEIKNIYLGANMADRDKERLLELVNDGPFDPKIWQTSLSISSFELEFNECS